MWWLLDHTPEALILLSIAVSAYGVHRFLGWRAALAIVVVGLFALFTKRTYERGASDARQTIDDRTNDLRESFDEIDREHTDPASAYEHLRSLQPNRRD